MENTDIGMVQEQNTAAEQQDVSLPRMFRRTERLLHRYMDTKKRDAFDAERGQGRLLALLKKTGPLPQKDIAFLMGIRQQSLGELVRKLEENKLVTRSSSPEDKRIMIVSLTEAGEAVEMPKLPFEEIFGCLDSQEQENLKDYLTRICTRIKEMLPEDAGDGYCGRPAPWGPDERMFAGPRPPHGCGRGPRPEPGPGPHHHHHHRAPEGYCRY